MFKFRHLKTLFLILTISAVNCRRRIPEWKKSCKFCLQYLDRSSDDDGPGPNTWDRHWRNYHDGVGGPPKTQHDSDSSTFEESSVPQSASSTSQDSISESDCSFCLEYLDRATDISGPGADTWNQHYRAEHDGVRWMADRSSSHDNSDESESDDNDDDEGNHNGEIRVVGQSTTSKRKFKNPFYQRKKKKTDTTIVLDSSSDDGQTIVLDSLSDDSNVNSRPNLHPLRNEEDFQNGIDQASTPISENPPQFITIELFGTRWNFPPFLDGANDYEVQRLLDSSMETTPTQPAPTFEQSSTSAVCLRRQNTSEPYAFVNSPQDSSKKGKGLGKNTSRGGVEYKNRQIADQCRINFQTTSIGDAPILDLVCISPDGGLVSVAQYQQEPCVKKPDIVHNEKNRTYTNYTEYLLEKQHGFSSTPKPPSNLNLFAEANEIFHSCASIRQFTRRKRFLGYIFGGFLTLTINAILLSEDKLTLPDCPENTLKFAHICINKFYEKCPQNMVNIHFFQNLQ